MDAVTLELDRSVTEIPDISRTPLPSHRPLRILLAKPDISDTSVGFTSLARVAPLELITVAATVPAHDVRVFDARLESEDAFVSELREFEPDLVGITAYSAESLRAKEMSCTAKTVLPGVTVVQGGHHASMSPEDALTDSAVDFIVRFEAERTFPELIEALQVGCGFNEVESIGYNADGVICLTPRGPQVKDLDTSPLPQWDLVARYQGKYYLNVLGTVGSVETTRGCPYDCSFCSVWKFHNRTYRKKSVDRVLEEMERLPECQVVGFVDDEFWVDGSRSLALADRINAQPEGWRGKAWNYFAQVRISDIARTPELVADWAKAGMKVLLLGIESHKEEELESLHHKHTTLKTVQSALQTMYAHGVEAWGCFIVNPEWGKKDFEDLGNFVLRHKIAFPQFTVLTPLPGTVLTNQLIARGLLDFRKVHLPLLDFLHAATPTNLPLRSFYENLARLYQRTSLENNLEVYKRALRNGVISTEWVRSEMGTRVRHFFTTLTNPETYLQAHRLLGQEV